MSLEAVDVLPASDTLAPLRRYAGEEISRNLRLFGTPPDSSRPLAIDAGRTAVLYIWAPTQRAGAPRSLRHRVSVRVIGRQEPVVSLTERVEVNRAAPVVIGAPVRGDGWIAGVGPNPQSVPVHDRLIYPTGGHIYAPQRFAIDFVKSGADGRLFHGDSAKNANFASYNEPVIAVADGVIRLVHDGVAENVPPDPPERMTTATVAGNYVLLDIGSGRHVFYGHLATGSTTVRAGQRVKRGATLGRVGNTGNSTGPHLHFQVVDAPAVGAAEGIAYVFDSFELLGRITDEQFDATDRGNPIGPFPAHGAARRRDLPLGGSVVNFPR
jgi:hypothetical protein